MKKSTIVLIVVATLAGVGGLYFLFYKLSCHGGHGMGSYGCCCGCGGGSYSGSNGSGSTNVLGSGRPGTIVVVPTGMTGPSLSDSLIINLAGGAIQPVTFDVVLPEGSSAVPILYISKKGSTGNWVPYATITGGMFTMINYSGFPKDFGFLIKYSETEFFGDVDYVPEPDGHGFDAHYSKVGVTATVGVH